MHDDPIADAAYRAAEYGADRPLTFHVGPNADIRLAEGTGRLLEGATITGSWS